MDADRPPHLLAHHVLQGVAATLRTRVRHIKRGTTYQVITVGVMESDEMPIVVYQSEHDGRVWVRPMAEFCDGRFEKIST